MQADQLSPEAIAAIAEAVQAQIQPTPAWVKALDVADKIVKIAAIIIGAVWAYYKFVRGRMFKPRLEPSVSGDTFRKDNRDYLIASIALKNVGTSRVEIKQEGTALRVFGWSEQADEADWHRIITLSVFEKHGWIESAEVIDDHLLVPIPEERLALKLELRVVGKGFEWKAQPLEWNAKTILPVQNVEREKPQSWLTSFLANIARSSSGG